MTMRLKARFPVTADISSIWRDLSKISRVSLGGEDSQYVLYFIGDREDGLTVIKRALQEDEAYIGIDYSEGSGFYDY